MVEPTHTIPQCDEPCPIERTMRVVGGKWKGSILWKLQDGPVRFNALCRDMGGASKKMIDQRLKELESYGMIKRTVLTERPISVSYEITPFGRSCIPILEQMKAWATEHKV